MVGLDFSGIAEFFETGGDGGFVDQNGLFVEVFECWVDLVGFGCCGEGTPSKMEEGAEEAGVEDVDVEEGGVIESEISNHTQDYTI